MAGFLRSVISGTVRRNWSTRFRLTSRISQFLSFTQTHRHYHHYHNKHNNQCYETLSRAVRPTVHYNFSLWKFGTESMFLMWGGIRGQIFEIFLRHFPKIFLCQIITNSKEVFLSEFSTAFFAFPKNFFFSYLPKLVQPIRCTYTNHVT